MRHQTPYSQTQSYLTFGCTLSHALERKFKKRGRMARQLWPEMLAALSVGKLLPARVSDRFNTLSPRRRRKPTITIYDYQLKTFVEIRNR